MHMIEDKPPCSILPTSGQYEVKSVSIIVAARYSHYAILRLTLRAIPAWRFKIMSHKRFVECDTMDDGLKC